MSGKFIKKILASDNGSTAIEYALVAALIGVVLVGTLTTISGRVNTSFTTISTNMSNAR